MCSCAPAWSASAIAAFDGTTVDAVSTPPVTDDEAVRRIGRKLLDRSLPKPEWTHAAHFAATLFLMRERPDFDLIRELPRTIWRYNEATGRTNTDTEGYHETITKFYIEAIGVFLRRIPAGTKLGAAFDLLMASRFGARDFALDYYSKDVLQSVEARRVWVEPDLKPFDFESVPLPG